MERQTRQKDAIRKAFAEAGVPLSPREVLERASRSARGLGLATVYRSIRALVEQGDLVPVELPGEAARYEVSGKDHHHHFSCTRCQRVFEVEGCPGNLKGLTPPGFRLVGHDLVLFGLCDACNRSETPEKAAHRR
jgi:Fur family ferric uptake transcriptional regulator